MRKISEFRQERLIYNHVIYNTEVERHFAKHSHSLLEMIFVLQGEVTYAIENKKFVARSGDLIIIKPYAYHFFSVTNEPDYEKISILLPSEQLDTTMFGAENFLLLPCGNSRIEDIFQKADFYYHNCPQAVFKELLISLAKEIWINVQLFHLPNVVTEHRQIHPLIERTIEYVNDHLFAIETVKDLASRLCVSEGYLKTLFVKQMKISIKKYITEKKMLMARSMILSGTPPTQAAFQCGYSHYVTFYRLYVKMFKSSPTSEYKG